MLYTRFTTSVNENAEKIDIYHFGRMISSIDFTIRITIFEISYGNNVVLSLQSQLSLILSHFKFASCNEHVFPLVSSGTKKLAFFHELENTFHRTLSVPFLFLKLCHFGNITLKYTGILFTIPPSWFYSIRTILVNVETSTNNRNSGTIAVGRHMRFWLVLGGTYTGLLQ